MPLGDYRLAGLIAITLDRDPAAQGGDDPLVAGLPLLSGVLSGYRPLVTLGWFDRTLLLAYANAAEAARTAQAIAFAVGEIPRGGLPVISASFARSTIRWRAV